MDGLVVIIVLFVCGLIGTMLWENKGGSGTIGFLTGVLLGPLGVLLLAIAKPDPKGVAQRQMASGAMRKCPHCAELIRSEAKVCRYCGRDVIPVRLAAPRTK